METGLLAQPASHTVLRLNEGCLEEADLHCATRQRASAVTGSARASVEAETHRLVDPGKAHVDALRPAFTGGQEGLDRSGRADIGALPAQDAGAFACHDVGSEGVCEAAFEPGELDAAVGAGVAALEATRASRQERVLIEGPRRSQPELRARAPATPE